MDIIQPSILSGFMELLPEDQVLFQQLLNVVERNFQQAGFWPLDTPAIEKMDILLSKGGGETSKQIYRIDETDHSTPQALRFDLTVPLARYVAQYQSELAFPFRRYQIAKVWRGERNQKGRYREFYQADIDIVGRDNLSLWNDAEILSVIDPIFQELNLGQAVFHINHRGLLNGYFASLGIVDSEECLHIIDKMDKLPEEDVELMLKGIGLNDDQIENIFDFMSATGDNEETLKKLEERLTEEEMNDLYRQGLKDLKFVYQHMVDFGISPDRIEIDLSITRGLDYYTGMVYETFLKGYESIGSVCSGGRYDNLASNFSKENFPGIGVSIGLTRLFYQLKEAKLIEAGKGNYLLALILPMSDAEAPFALEVLKALRKEGISCQLYTEAGKMKKKFSYADKLGARFVIILGEEERNNGVLSIKDLEKGNQETMTLEEAVTFLHVVN